jgi:osmotically-inducible protein OsmY
MFVCGEVSTFQATLTSLFKTIPPERVGLDGEYDYYGLAKRVSLAFGQNFNSNEIKNLYVTQRGRVVILKGQVANSATLTKLVNIAKGVSGATDVETRVTATS